MEVGTVVSNTVLFATVKTVGTEGVDLTNLSQYKSPTFSFLHEEAGSCPMYCLTHSRSGAVVPYSTSQISIGLVLGIRPN